MLAVLDRVLLMRYWRGLQPRSEPSGAVTVALKSNPREFLIWLTTTLIGDCRFVLVTEYCLSGTSSDDRFLQSVTHQRWHKQPTIFNLLHACLPGVWRNLRAWLNADQCNSRIPLIDDTPFCMDFHQECT